MADFEPLVVLLCVSERSISRRLYFGLSSNPRVRLVVEVGDVAKACDRIAERDIGLVVVDAALQGAMAARGLIASAREQRTVVALLRSEPSASNGAVGVAFRDGLLTMDAAMPDDLAPGALDELLRRAQEARDPRSAGALREPERTVPAPVRPAVERPSVVPAEPVAGTVFLSYRFAEESGYVQGLRLLLRDRGFEVVTGRGAEGSVSAAVLRRIRDSDTFLALMTRHRPIAEPAGTWTTSSWLIEEKGAALAFGKRIVLLVEEGITDIGGLQGDWQRNVFTPQTFMTAALEAVRQLMAGGDPPQ